MLREDLKFAPVYRISPDPRGMLAIVDQQKREEHTAILFTSIHILRGDAVHVFKSEYFQAGAECIVNVEEDGVKGHHIFVQPSATEQYWLYAGYKDGEME